MVSRLLAATSLEYFAVVFASAVYTQDGSGDAEGAQPREWLPEIVVTAQKRTENLQDVPVPVSALNAGQIERSFSRDISEIGALPPNLVIDPLYGVASASRAWILATTQAVRFVMVDCSVTVALMLLTCANLLQFSI